MTRFQKTPGRKVVPKQSIGECERMNVLRHGIYIPLFLSLAVLAIALPIRPPLPVDETRYLAVAWDMWLKGNYLVPHLNGAPYSHKL